MRVDLVIEPFVITFSSHGTLVIEAMDLPAALGSPLPGIMYSGSNEVLNETWDSQGREPLRLEGNDDGMPVDLQDPRLQRCVTNYVGKHRPELDELHEQARRKWQAVLKEPQRVDGIVIMPEQKVRWYYSKGGARSSTIDKGEYSFLLGCGNTLYLRTPEGIAFPCDLRGSNGSRSWLEVVDKR